MVETIEDRQADMVDETDGIPEDEPKKGEEDGGEEGGEESTEKKKFLSGKMMIILAGVAVLLIGGGAGGWFFFMGDDMSPGKQAEKAAVKAGYYDLPEMIVNLNSKKGMKHFLKVKIALKVRTKREVSYIKPYEPAVLDTFQTYLRELRLDDLEGSAGLFRLKTELLKRVNSAVHPQQISAVLFKEIIVQ